MTFTLIYDSQTTMSDLKQSIPKQHERRHRTQLSKTQVMMIR